MLGGSQCRKVESKGAWKRIVNLVFLGSNSPLTALWNWDGETAAGHTMVRSEQLFVLAELGPAKGGTRWKDFVQASDAGAPCVPQ